MEEKKISTEAKKKNSLGEIREEYKKIVWPDKKTLYKQTLTVITTSLIFGAIVFGFDTIYTFVFALIAKLV